MVDNAQSDPPPEGAYQFRTWAKDMLGDVSASMLRSMVDNCQEEDLRETFGLSLEEARISLRCIDLAALRAWDLQAVVEAASVFLLEQRDSLRAVDVPPSEAAAVDGALSRVERCVRLAARAEEADVLLHPADAVLLLERSGIDVYFELRDAVQTHLGGQENLSPGDWERLRKLAGAPSGAVPTRSIVATGQWWEEGLAEIAQQIADKEHSMGRPTSKNAVAPLIAKRLQQIDSAPGKQGRTVAAETIRKYGLKSWTFRPS